MSQANMQVFGRIQLLEDTISSVNMRGQTYHSHLYSYLHMILHFHIPEIFSWIWTTSFRGTPGSHTILVVLYSFLNICRSILVVCLTRNVKYFGYNDIQSHLVTDGFLCNRPLQSCLFCPLSFYYCPSLPESLLDRMRL